MPINLKRMPHQSIVWHISTELLCIISVGQNDRLFAPVGVFFYAVTSDQAKWKICRFNILLLLSLFWFVVISNFAIIINIITIHIKCYHSALYCHCYHHYQHHCQIIWYHYIILYFVMLYHIISYLISLYCIVLHHIMSNSYYVIYLIVHYYHHHVYDIVIIIHYVTCLSVYQIAVWNLAVFGKLYHTTQVKSFSLKPMWIIVKN